MKLIITALAALVILFIFIRFLEYKSLYYPFRNIDATPADIGLVFEEVRLTTKDGVQISGWFIPSESPRATLLFAHGNGGNISHRLDKIGIFHDLHVNTLIFDYRGYGKSSGSPSEDGLYLDAETFYEYLRTVKGIPARRIVGYGESLGGAVITNLAAEHELGGLIIESSFSSIRDIGKKIFPFIPGVLYKTKFDSLSKIEGIRYPKLMMHSTDDDIVPFILGQRLFDAAPEPKVFVRMRGRHNEAFLVSEELFTSEIDSFLGLL